MAGQSGQQSETYVVYGELPIEAFADAPLVQFYWIQMRQKAEKGIKGERPGWRIGEMTDDISSHYFGRMGPIGDPHPDGTQDMALWPCREEEAEVVGLRLVVRALPPGGQAETHTETHMPEPAAPDAQGEV